METPNQKRRPVLIITRDEELEMPVPLEIERVHYVVGYG